VFVFPEIELTPASWEKVSRRTSFYYYDNSICEKFRNCLYTLLYQPEKYGEAEDKLLKTGELVEVGKFYMGIFEDERYYPFLHKISKIIVKNNAILLVNNAINNLVSLSEVEEKIEKIGSFSNYPNLKQINNFELNTAFWCGNMDKAMALDENISDFKAIKYLTDGNVSESIKFFNKGLKEQHSDGNKSPLPFQSYIAYFYMVAMLMSDTVIKTSVFQKVIQWNLKNGYGFYNMFMTIVYDALSEQKDRLPNLKNILKLNIISKEIDKSSITDILIYYLVNEKIEEEYADNVYNVIKKAVDANYWLLGYEAAFVAKKWFNEKRFEDLYQELILKMNYLPVISQIIRQEEWEKSLNLLLGIKTKPVTKTNDNNARVIYYFNPKTGNIQPVLQTRQASGWSSGRNIALKTFHAADTKGMTDLDVRISKHIKLHNDYYNSYLNFDGKVFLDLIGHPTVNPEKEAKCLFQPKTMYSYR
jgi:hypothetical protein